MKEKIIINHQKGHRYAGKTNWSEVVEPPEEPIIDDENPELAYKNTFRKVEKNDESN